MNTIIIIAFCFASFHKKSHCLCVFLRLVRACSFLCVKAASAVYLQATTNCDVIKCPRRKCIIPSCGLACQAVLRLKSAFSLPFQDPGRRVPVYRRLSEADPGILWTPVSPSSSLLRQRYLQSQRRGDKAGRRQSPKSASFP